MSGNTSVMLEASTLRLRGRYKPYPVEGEGLFLVGDGDYEVFEGQIFVDLFPLLQDGLDGDAIADALEATYTRPAVHYALGILKEHRMVTDLPCQGSPAEDAFWDDFNLDSHTARQRLAAATAGITTVGAVQGGAIVQALRSLGMRAALVEEPSDESLHIVVTDDYLAPELSALAAANRRDGRPWLLVRSAGTELWLGPLFRQGTACLECLTWRLRTNRALERYLARRLGGERGITRATAQMKPLGGLIANLVALETAKFVAGYTVDGPCVKTIDLRTLQVQEHHLTRRPQCGVCGDPQLQADILTQPVKIDANELPAWKTLDDLTPFVSKITGIVTSLKPAATGIESLYCYNGIFGFGRDATDFQALKKSFISQAAGVGTNAEDAKVGAICEALERYSGMYQGDEPAVDASYRQLDPETAIHPNACMLYSARQYQRRDQINAQGAAFDMVPKPFDETATMGWTGVWSLSAERFKLAPSSYLYYSYPQPEGGPFCWADSNGCAAGKTLTDAIRRGLYELVERDCVAMWWYNRLRRPRVDLASFHYDYFQQFIEFYASLEREAWVLDITNDLGIPAFAAISRSLRGKPEDILVSFGAHLDARAAIEHALCEMNHLLPAVLPQNRDSSGDYLYPEIAQRHWWRTATIETEPYLLPNTNLPATGAGDFGPASPLSEAGQAAVVCDRLEKRGLEVLVLNQTRPDVNIPVAKVMVPGMRHFWSRLAPGRLYDVPVNMGWLDRPLSEPELNPIAMFL